MSKKEIVIYDTEYWTSEGAPARRWDGLDDYPPLLIQIGAFKVLLETGLPILDEYAAYVLPKDENGAVVPITDFFTELTKIPEKTVLSEGRELQAIMQEFKAFTGNRLIYSYGNDILSTIVPSCYIRGIECPFPPKQFRDIRDVFRKTSLTDTEITKNTSGSIAGYLGIQIPDHYAHDARNDALSIIEALRLFLKNNELDLDWFMP